MSLIAILVSALGGYLLGSIPFGLVLTRLAGLGDIREVGSGNIGATNVLRTGRKDLAFATLLLDSGKAGIAALIAGLTFGAPLAPLAGAAAFLGHCYPVWLGFKGGKGVATFVGAAIALSFPIALIICGAWLTAASLFGYSSLAALIAAALAPLVALSAGNPGLAAAFGVMAVVIFWRHRANIRRLMSGDEPRIGQKNA